MAWILLQFQARADCSPRMADPTPGDRDRTAARCEPCARRERSRQALAAVSLRRHSHPRRRHRPELADADGHRHGGDRADFEWRRVRRRRVADRRSTARRCRSTCSTRSARRRSRSRARSPRRRRGLPIGQRDAASGARPVRQPAPGAVDEGRRDALRERRSGHRAREHRGPVRGHRAQGRSGRRREHQDHHARRRRSGSRASPSTTPWPTAGTR